MEWQVRNWLFTGWASGDHIVEQHVHNLDVMNWAFGAHPVKCTGMGGRAARTDRSTATCREHLRPLRRRVRVPERGARDEHVPPDGGGGGERLGARGRRHRLLLHGQRGRLHQGGEALREPAGLAQPVRGGARRPHREHQGRQAPERGAAGRGELPDRDHGPDERLHGARAELGVGHELLEARPHPAAHGLRRAAAARGRRSRARRRSSEGSCYRQAAGSDFSKYGR